MCVAVWKLKSYESWNCFGTRYKAFQINSFFYLILKCFIAVATSVLSLLQITVSSAECFPSIAETLFQHWFLGERNHLLNQCDHILNILILREKENSHRILKTIGSAAFCWGKSDNNGLWFKYCYAKVIYLSLGNLRKQGKCYWSFIWCFSHCSYKVRSMMWVFVADI